MTSDRRGRGVILALAVALSAGAFGCAGLRLHLVDASVQQPSNVAVYFTVDTHEGTPVGGLKAEQFNIYEDGRLISQYESKQTILNPEVATVRYTLLLLDMSGSIVESGQVPVIQEAVGAFTENVGEQEQVAIYAFDGRAEIQEIAGFATSGGRLDARTARLSSFTTEDPSTNLHGAIIAASGVLHEAMEASEVPLSFGTLVVFTDGTDRAHRATAGDAMRAVRRADVSIWVIGLGGEVDEEEMEYFGRDGYVHASQGDSVASAFQEVAEQIRDLAGRFYLLSYCSPARAGTHRLEVESVYGELRGRVSYDFDAEGFEPDCDPSTPPAFAVPGTEPRRRSRRGSSRAPASRSETMDFEGSAGQE